MKLEETRQLAQVLAAAVKGLRLYSIDHPATVKQVQSLQNCLINLLRQRRTLKMGVLEGVLFVDDFLFTQEFPAAHELARLFSEHDLAGVEFQDASAEELQTLLAMLHASEPRGAAFAVMLQQLGVERVRAVPSTEEDDSNQPRKVYHNALKVVEQIFNDVRMGEIPSSEEAMKVVRSMAQLTITEPHALFALSMLKNYDNYTFTHSVNVSVIALAVGRACAVSEEELRLLGLGGLLHDLGKLKIDVAIINKPGRLNDSEFEKIKLHPRFGADIVMRMEGIGQEVLDIVLGHHVRFDRCGYPQEVTGRDISPLVEMAAVADAYDAMTTLRSYQRPFTPRRAIARLREISGTNLHPTMVERFSIALGPYPVGSLVRLDSNEVGLVVKVDTTDPSIADVKIIFSEGGAQLREPYLVHLSPAQPRQIVAEVDPYSKGIEVTDFFD